MRGAPTVRAPGEASEQGHTHTDTPRAHAGHAKMTIPNTCSVRGKWALQSSAPPPPCGARGGRCHVSFPDNPRRNYGAYTRHRGPDATGHWPLPSRARLPCGDGATLVPSVSGSVVKVQPGTAQLRNRRRRLPPLPPPRGGKNVTCPSWIVAHGHEGVVDSWRDSSRDKAAPITPRFWARFIIGSPGHTRFCFCGRSSSSSRSRGRRLDYIVSFTRT